MPTSLSPSNAIISSPPVTLTTLSNARRELGATIVAHLHALMARATQLCRGHVDADDLVQETVVRAFEAKQPLRDPSRALAWLLAILQRTFIDAARRSRRRSPIAFDVESADFAAEEPAEPPPWHSIDNEDVQSAIARLSDDVRDVYRMFAIDGCSYAEIAATVQIPTGTVGTRILRARKQLRALLAAKARHDISCEEHPPSTS